MKLHVVENLDLKTKKEILDSIQSLKNSATADKELTLDLNSTQGEFQFALEIATEAIQSDIMINADCKGELDASGAILAALSKCTLGKSTAFFSTTFQLFKNNEKSGKLINSTSDEIRKSSIAKTLKHLRCKSALINSLLDTGEIFSSDTAKKCGIVNEVMGLPSLKKSGKKKSITNKKNSEMEKKNEDDSSGKLTVKSTSVNVTPKSQSGEKPVEVSK